jgi:hypothetical protein
MRLMRGLPQRLPSGVASQLGVLPGEKVIAWGSHAPVDDVPANYAIATSRALYIQVPSIRITWHEVSKATWTDPVLEITPEGASGPAFRVDLDEARDLPAAVHDRVTDSVVISEWVELTPPQRAPGWSPGATAMTDPFTGRSSSMLALIPRTPDCGQRWTKRSDAFAMPSESDATRP